MSTSAHLPLTGTRVLDLTHVWSGPMATRVLCGLGAEVVKIESVRRRDALRGNGAGDLPLRYPDGDTGADPENRNAWFNTQNTGKRSVVIDLSTDEGLALAHRLVAVSDVLIANYRPGALDRMGLGYERVRQIRDDIVVVEMPGFPADSPQAKAPAFGAQFDANSGSATLTGDGDEPLLTGFALGDPTAGLFAAAAVVSVLHRRRTSGAGAHVVLPQVEAMMPLLGEYYLAESLGTPIVEGLNGDRRAVPHGLFRTADGSWLALAVRSDREWTALAAVLDAVDPGIGGRFPSADDRRLAADHVEGIVRRWAAGLPSARSVVPTLQEAGVPAAPLNDGRDLAGDRQLAASGFFATLEHPSAGTHRHPGLPYAVDGARPSVASAAPVFGADTEWCLRELLGLSAGRTTELEEHGVVWQAGAQR